MPPIDSNGSPEAGGSRALAVADLRDEIELHRAAAGGPLGRSVLGIFATLFFLFYVVSGVGTPAILLALVSGTLTWRCIRGYQQAAARLKALEEGLAALLDPFLAADLRDEIEVEEIAARRTLWIGVLVPAAATAFVVPFLLEGAGIPAVILGSAFAALTCGSVLKYHRSTKRLEGLKDRLGALLEPAEEGSGDVPRAGAA